MKPFLRIALAYAVFGLTWILVSDRLAVTLAPDISSLSWFQTIKGAFFVLASASLIYGLSRRYWRQLQAEQTKRERIFHKTIEVTHHILLNYLNKMQLVTMEAEKCRDFDRECLQLAKDSTAEASAELARLEQVKAVTDEEIDATGYRDLSKK